MIIYSTKLVEQTSYYLRLCRKSIRNAITHIVCHKQQHLMDAGVVWVAKRRNPNYAPIQREALEPVIWTHRQ